MGKRKDRWDALDATGKKVTVVLAVLLFAGIMWVLNRPSEATACDDFRATVQGVQDGEQDANSRATLDDLAAVAAKAVDEGGDVGQAGTGMSITLQTRDEDPNADENLASQVRLMDEACSG